MSRKKSAPLKDSFKKSCGFVSGSKGSSCPKPEDMLFGGIFAFTYNPAEQPSYDGVTSFSDWYNDVTDTLTSLNSCDIRCFPEMSKSGRWHFHGIIKIHDTFQWFSRDIKILDKSGHYEVDTFGVYRDIDGYVTWLTYMYKQQMLIRKFMLKETVVMVNDDDGDSFIGIDTEVIRRSQ